MFMSVTTTKKVLSPVDQKTRSSFHHEGWWAADILAVTCIAHQVKQAFDFTLLIHTCLRQRICTPEEWP